MEAIEKDDVERVRRLLDSVDLDAPVSLAVTHPLIQAREKQHCVSSKQLLICIVTALFLVFEASSKSLDGDKLHGDLVYLVS